MKNYFLNYLDRCGAIWGFGPGGPSGDPAARPAPPPPTRPRAAAPRTRSKGPGLQGFRVTYEGETAPERHQNGTKTRKP